MINNKKNIRHEAMLFTHAMQIRVNSLYEGSHDEII